MKSSLMEMGSEESLERSEYRERERERRRMRDRQRRQSMTAEEKEHQLARRRRNYRLRRQRQSDSQPQQIGIASISVKVTASETQTLPHGSDLIVQCATVHTQGNGQTIVHDPRFEAALHKSDELPKSLRLNHIRHLARSRNNTVGGLTGENDQMGSDEMMKENESACYQLPKRLRLTYVKHLARSTKRTSDHNCQSGTEEKESLAQPSKHEPMSSDMIDHEQPFSILEEGKQITVDGLYQLGS